MTQNANKLALDVNKFAFMQMFNNSKGKTSLALVCGAIMIVTACFGFIYGTLFQYEAVFLHSTAFATCATTLLVTRRFTQDKTLNPTQYDEPTQN